MEEGLRRLVLVVGNLLGYLSVIIINVIAGMGKLHGVTPGDISERHFTKFTPDGYAFAIWSIIFTLNGIFVLYQAFPMKRDSYFIFNAIGPWFILNSIFMLIWPFCFHWDSMWSSAIFITLILITLIVIYVRLGIDYSINGRYRTDPEGIPITRAEYWLLQVPFSIFLGWITVATIANWAIALSTKTQTLGWTASGWSSLLQTIAALLALLILIRRYDPFFSLVISWALFAIASKHHVDPVVSTAAFVNGSIVLIASLSTIGYLLFSYCFTKKYTTLNN